MSSKKLRKAACIDDAALNLIIILIIACILLPIMTGAYLIITKNASLPGSGGGNVPAGSVGDYPFKQSISITKPNSDNSLIIPQDSMNSEFAIVVDVTDGLVLASRKGSQPVNPASMTKVMSLIVIVENLSSEEALKDKITITQEHIDRKKSEKHSGEIRVVGEIRTVEDLIYAFILDSDGIAGIALAEHISGSEYNFVQLMNEKSLEMGLSNTNFMNCTGIHHQYHYTTCQDMAMIMTYAMKNPMCAKVLSTLKYSTATNVSPDGISSYHDLLVTKLQDEHPINTETVSIIAGKTGWTGDDSGRCLVSYAKGDNGHMYVVVTAKAPNQFDEVKDHENLYNTYVK